MAEGMGPQMKGGSPAFMDRLLLAQATVDYDVAGRGEKGLVGRLLASPATRVALSRGGRVAVPARTGSVAPAALDCDDDPAAPRPDAQAPDGDVALALLDGPRAAEVASVPGALVAYLGVDRAATPPASFLGIDLTVACEGPRGSWPPALAEAVGGLDWVELRSFAPCAPARDAGLATSLAAVGAWHAGQRFCPRCGRPVRPALAGWAQRCDAHEGDAGLLFPRIEPAVITAITDDADRILLQHNSAWRERFLSVSAGFVEAGESLEHAVAREAAEEVGVELADITYLGSQPWPFPASIMLGFRARACGGVVRPDHDEVASARWFAREELRAAVEAGEVHLPGRASIARHLIEDWYGGPVEGASR